MINGRVTGAKALRRRINTIQAGLPLLVSRDRMSAFLLRRIKERFLKEQSPDGTRWARLSPNTKPGLSILRSTSALYNNIDVLDGAGGFGSATGAGFRIGVKNASSQQPGRRRTDNPAVYGRYHNLGIGVKRRRFLGVGRLDIKAVDSLLRRELHKLVEGA